MQFYEKLIFLQNLLQISNRMLARELQVDPSLISRLRTGSRGIPRNRERIKTMAAYFAKRCISVYQRKTLSEILGIRQAFTAKEEHLSEILFYWLSEDPVKLGRFTRTSESITVEGSDSTGTSASCIPSADNTVYYGNEGKRAAIRALYQLLSSIEKPGTVYIMTDESDNWITEDDDFGQELKSWWITLARRGFYFCYIAPPVSPVDLAFESLARWLPLYMTGQVSAYFYPRFRDQVHRRTLIVIPGHNALISNSVLPQTEATATILTSDQRLTQSYLTLFQNYRSMCRPILHTYASAESLMHCFTRFFALKGTWIQKLPSLSTATAPPELIDLSMEHVKNPYLKNLHRFYTQELALLEDSRNDTELIDIVYLASAEEVRSGKVPVVLSFGSDADPLIYTPKTYCMHLEHIIHILETHRHYHFIPMDPSTKKDGAMLVKDGQKALIMNLSPVHDHSLTVYEISQPEIIQLCQEHLYTIAGQIGYTEKSRMRTISLIKERIRELKEDFPES